MSLADRLAQPPQVALRGPECTVRRLMRQLEGADREAFESALRDEDAWPGSTLADTMRSEGYDVGGQTIMRHRRRQCSCDRRDGT